MNTTITAGAESTTTTDKANYFGATATGGSDSGNNQAGVPNTWMKATIDSATPKDFNGNEIAAIADIVLIHNSNESQTGTETDARKTKILTDLQSRTKADATAATGTTGLTDFAKANNIDKGGKSVYLMANVDDPNGEFPKTVSLSFYNSNYMAEGSEVNFELDITKAVEIKL